MSKCLKCLLSFWLWIVVYDDNHIARGERNSADCCDGFCRCDFRSFTGSRCYQSRHICPADHNGNKRIVTLRH